MKLAFLGLGVMGYPMAGYLTTQKDAAGNPAHQVRVFNRTQEKTQRWAMTYAGEASDSPAACVADADLVFACLGRDEDVTAVMLADTFLASLKPGALVVDHTTTSYQLTQTLAAALSQRGVRFVDAPVSGGSVGAENGVLSIMAGGEKADIDRASAVMQVYAKQITHMGAVGHGQLAKMVNQICIAGVLKGLSEGLKFAEAEGIDNATLLSAIGGGAAQSWQMENRLPTMGDRAFGFGFAIKWMIKDLGYCVDRAAENGTNLSLTQQVLDEYKSLDAAGHGQKDTSSLILHHDF